MGNNVDAALEDLSCATERPVSHDESGYDGPQEFLVANDLLGHIFSIREQQLEKPRFARIDDC